MKDAQKIATTVFITASLLFGVWGIILILSAPQGQDPAEWLFKVQVILGFIVLSSFGVSVGFKYLSDK